MTPDEKSGKRKTMRDEICLIGSIKDERWSMYMGFRNGAYATIWKVKDGKGNYKEVQLSVSRKNKNTGEYQTEFNAWVRFVGMANERAEQLEEKSRIKIEACDVTNSYDREKKITYTNYTIFDFEVVGDRNAQPGVTDGFMTIPENIE